MRPVLFRLTFKVDDKRTGAVPYLDDAFVFQFPVGLDNCCWAQDKVARVRIPGS